LANLFNDGITSSIHAKLSYDSRDNRLFPTSGQFHTISGEFADSRIGSENIFTRYRAISRWFFPLGWGMVLKLKGSFGVVVSDSPQGVPIFERFFPGGIFTVRGFLPQSLGPRLFLPRSLDPNANPLPWGFNIGGNMQLIFNFELEYPIFKKAGIMGVIFLDAGNAFNLEENLCRASSGYGVTKFTDPCVVNPIYLRASCGFGFRWFSPLGPLRFEWGIPLFRFKGEEAILFEFTIGSFF
jgi:outer membrane protein insertion porin family